MPMWMVGYRARALLLGLAWASAVTATPAWTNVAGNAIVGEVVAIEADAVLIATGGAVTQRLARTVFPAAELSRMGSALGVSDAAELVPPAIDPAYREFADKCAARSATRGDLLALKRFIANSALTQDEKRRWTQKVRRAYQEMRAVRLGPENEDGRGKVQGAENETSD